jgi:integrase/recombinase XerD
MIGQWEKSYWPSFLPFCSESNIWIRRRRGNMQKIWVRKQKVGAGNIFVSPIPKQMEILSNKEPYILVEGFTRYLVEDGKRPKTIESYIGDVTGFVDFLVDMGMESKGELERFHITSYRNYLVKSGYEASTINKKINSLQSFNQWQIAKGITKESVVDLRKDRVKVVGGSEKQVEIYQERQLDRLLFFIRGEQVSVRDRAIVLTLLYSGVRVSELCDIKVRNVDFMTGHLKVCGKGGKVREVPMKQEVIEAIKEYLADRSKNKYSESEYLFLGQRGPIQRDAVNTMLEKLTDTARLDFRLKPHAFRHTFCSRLVSKGVPLTTVSKLAGHSSIETTAKFYVNSSRDDKMRAVNLL